jgi:hypothetical protein
MIESRDGTDEAHAKIIRRIDSSYELLAQQRACVCVCVVCVVGHKFGVRKDRGNRKMMDFDDD